MAADDLESAKQNARHRLNDTRASARSRSSRHIRRNHQAQEQKLKPDYSNMFGSFQAAGPATTLRGGCPPPSHTWFSDLTISDFTGYGHTVGLRGGAVSEEYDEDEEVGENDDVLMLDAPQNCAGFAMTSNDNAPLSLRGGSSQTAEPNSNGDEDTTVIASLEARIVRKMKHLQDANPSLSEMEARQEAINILENVANIQSSVEYQSSVNAAAPSSPCLERTAPEDVEQTAVFYVESDYEYADEIPWTVEEEDAKIKELLDATEGTVSEAEAREAVEQHNAARRHVLNQRFPPSVGIDQTDPSFPGTGAGVENLVRTKWQTLAFNHCSPNAAQRLLIENHDYEQATLERGVYCHFCKATIYMPEIQCLEEHFRGHINRTGECAWCGMDIHKLDFEEKRDHLRSHRNWVTFKVNKIYSIATDPVSRIEKENETRNLQAALLLYCSGCGFDLRKIQNAKELIEHTKECPDGYHDSGDPRHCLYCGLELATLKNPQVHRGECRGTDAALFKDHQLNALVNANYDDSTTNCTRDEIYKALLLIVAPSDDREGELLRCRYAGCNYDLAEAVRTSRTVQPIQNHLNVHVKNKDQFRQTCPMQDCMTDLGVLSAEDKTIHMQTHMQTHMAGRAAASQPSPHQPQPVRPNPKSPEDTALSGEACHFPGCARQWLKEEMVEGQPRLVRAVVAKSHWKKHFGELKSGLYKDYVEKPGSYRHLLNEKRSKRECAFEQCQPREKSKFNDELLDGPKGQLYWRYHTQFHFDEADFMDDKHPFAKNPLDHDFSENTPKTPQRVAPVEPSAESGTNADAGASASRLDGDETPEPEGTDDRALTRYFETESPGMYEMIPQEWRNALKMLPKLEDADLLKHFDRAQVRAWKGPKTWIFFCRACTKTITGKHIWVSVESFCSFRCILTVARFIARSKKMA